MMPKLSFLYIFLRNVPDDFCMELDGLKNTFFYENNDRFFLRCNQLIDLGLRCFQVQTKGLQIETCADIVSDAHR